MSKLTVEELEAGIKAREDKIFMANMADFLSAEDKETIETCKKEIAEMKEQIEALKKPKKESKKQLIEVEPVEPRLNIYQKLARVQAEIKAPKNLFNDFGKYPYRNAEGIVNAFKEYESKYGVALLLSDTVIQVGERYYIEATATFIDTDTGETFKVTASARESITKKGMDDSQVTGTTSSYARKYALNGLLLLDDVKDADSNEYQNQTNRTEKATDSQIKAIKAICAERNVNLDKFVEMYNTTIDKLDKTTASQMLDRLKQ